MTPPFKPMDPTETPVVVARIDLFMTPQLAISVMSDALMTAFFICAPLLLIAFLLGIVVNIVQIATSLQDQVFSVVPRLIACLGGFLFLMPWMLSRAIGYTTSLIRDLSRFAH